METEEQRPYLIQGSQLPVFEGNANHSHDFICQSCKESVLIKNYATECYIGFGIRCVICQTISWLPDPNEGEVFPRNVVSLLEGNGYLVRETVNNPSDAVFASKRAIALTKRNNFPSKSAESDLDISSESIKLLVIKLDSVSNSRFSKHLESARRNLKHKKGFFAENPLAWAIALISSKLEKKPFEIDEQAIIAISLIQTTTHLIQRWEAHSEFPNIAIELCSSFRHTIIQLVSACYLFDNGNSVNINPQSSIRGQRSPDLYVQATALEKLYLEVKTPEKLQWPNSELTPGTIKKSIEKALSNSKGQINSSRKGVLIIGTTSLSPRLIPMIENIIENIFRVSGKNYPAVAAIALTSLTEVTARSRPAAKGRFTTNFFVKPILNKHYDGENPIDTN